MAYTRKHNRHTPRSWFRLFLRFGGWAGILFGLLLVIMTFISESRLYLAGQMDREGRYAPAVVMDKRVAISVDADGDESRSYYVEFRFKSADGGQDRETRVDRSYYNSVSRSDEVTIRYLRSDPGTIEVEEGQFRSAGLAFRWIGLLFGIGGLFVLWFVGGKAAAAVRARRFGKKRYGVVTGITETRWEVNDRKQARLAWREEDGQTGESMMRDLRYLSERYRAGDKIVVFRLGRKSYWEGDIGPPAEEFDREAE